jgi:hypothetical protein
METKRESAVCATGKSGPEVRRCISPSSPHGDPTGGMRPILPLLFRIDLQRRAIKQTRPLFFCTCLYLLSQSCMIPIAAVGPSWALWPSLADIGIFPVVLVALAGYRSRRAMTRYHRHGIALVSALVCVASLGLLHSWVGHVGRETLFYGAYFLRRFVEFAILFWAISQMEWTPARISWLRLIVDVVLVITCVGVLLTFFGIIPLGSLVSHLPLTHDAAGPWMAYPLKEKFPDDGRGIGFVGYNHAYAGVQILALTAFRFAIVPMRVSVWGGVVLLTAVIASFVTESRAGFAALIFFLATQFVRSPKLLVATLPLALVGAALLGESKTPVAATLERQQTTLAATEGDNLSGRGGIWKSYTTFMMEHPSTFIIGAGLGASYPITPNRSCHMTPLQYLFELGIVGFAVYGGIVGTLITTLVRFEKGTKPVLCALVALQIASLTMETFYPIPYLAHFLGLCAVIVGLSFSRLREDRWCGVQ